MLALVLATTGWVVTRPASKPRFALLKAKATGERPEVSWAQTIVSLAPIEWRQPIRAALAKTIQSLDAAAAAPQPWSRNLDLPPEPGAGFTMHKLFEGPTAGVRFLEVHLSILASGQSPHPPHRHEEEELIVPISGEVNILRAPPDSSAGRTTEQAGPGRLIYHPSDSLHTIQAGPDGPVRYLVFKWRGERGDGDRTFLGSASYEYANMRGQLAERNGGFASERIFEAPTLFLKLFHAHVSRVNSGVGYPPERDPYAIVMVLLSGAIATQGVRVEAPAVVFHPADGLHDVRGEGAVAAEYLVFELHGHADLDPL